MPRARVYTCGPAIRTSNFGKGGTGAIWGIQLLLLPGVLLVKCCDVFTVSPLSLLDLCLHFLSMIIGEKKQKYRTCTHFGVATYFPAFLSYTNYCALYKYELMYNETDSFFRCWVVAGCFLFFWSAWRQHLDGNTSMVKAGDQISGQCSCGIIPTWKRSMFICLECIWILNGSNTSINVGNWYFTILYSGSFVAFGFCLWLFYLWRFLFYLPLRKRCKHCCHFFCSVDLGQLQNVVNSSVWALIICRSWTFIKICINMSQSNDLFMTCLCMYRLLLYGDVACSVINSIPPP